MKNIIDDYPPFLQIEPTYICNYRCVFCYQTDNFFNKRSNGFMGHMTLDVFKKIIDQAEGHIEFISLASRGEPLLCPDIKKMLSYTKDKFLNLKINTNASLLDEKMSYAILESGVRTLVFSADAADGALYSKLRVNGKLEKTNDAYAIAKIAGIKMCESYNRQYKTNYKCLMPTNTFGPNDNYDELNSHFFPALIKKLHNIKLKKKNELVLWGNGQAKREVIYVDDLADACIYFMKKKTKETLINIGSGKDYKIKEYAKIFSKVITPNLSFKIKYDLSKPNGTPRKLLDVSLAKKYGWTKKNGIDKSN